MGGGNYFPVILEEGYPVLDLRFDSGNKYRYFLVNENENNFILNCGTEDWLMQFNIFIDEYHKTTDFSIIGTVISNTDTNGKIDFSVNTSSSNFSFYTENTKTWYDLDVPNGFDFNSWHKYIIFRSGNYIKAYVDGIFIGEIVIDKNASFSFLENRAIGFLWRRVIGSSLSPYPFYGKIKSFDWYKGDLVSFVTINLKLGD